MKILFVNPYIFDFTAYDLWLRPLGLLYLTAVVKEYTNCEIFWVDVLDRFQPKGINLTKQIKLDSLTDTGSLKSKSDGRGKFHREIVEKPLFYKSVPRNFSRYGMPVHDFLEKLNHFPDVKFIFITTLMTYWNDGVNFTIAVLRKRFPDAEILVGGILPTLLGKKIKYFIKADYFISGYGENQILDFLKQKGAHIFSHPDLADLNNIPLPAFEYLSNKKILPLLTSRGCPLNCSYCVSPILNDGFHARSVQKVKDEIASMVKNHSPEHMVIFDDALLFNRGKRFNDIFSELEPHSQIHFHTPNGLHAREINHQTAETLFRAGFKTLRLGFESLNPEILASSSNKVDVTDMKSAVAHLQNAGYKRNEIEAYLLFGYPGQTVGDLEETLFFVRDLGIIPRLAIFSPVPGSTDFMKLQKRGILSKKINLYETNKTYFLYQKSGFIEYQIQYINDLTRKIVLENQNGV